MNIDLMPAVVDASHPQPSARASNSSPQAFAQALAEHQTTVPSSGKLAAHDKDEQGPLRHHETQSPEEDGPVSQAVDRPADEPSAKSNDGPKKISPEDGAAPQAMLYADFIALLPDRWISAHVGVEDAAGGQGADTRLTQPVATAIQADLSIHAYQMRDAKLTPSAMTSSPPNVLASNLMGADANLDLSASTEVMAASRSWLRTEKKDSTQPHEPWVGLMSANSSTYKLSPQAVLPASPVLVAEQLKHWLVRDVQHAQLSLQGMGQEPVEVAIRLQGQMVHVMFGTDSPQARQLLEGSLRELSSLLLQDGLVLSGTSVGTSSQGQTSSRFGSSSFTQRPAASPKPVRELMSVDVQTPRLNRSGLDLYV